MTQHEPREKPVEDSAEVLAASLSQWQVLDMVQIHRNGPMRYCGEPCAPLRRMIADGILKRSDVPSSTNYVIPGRRFLPVLYALNRMGRIQSLTAPEAVG